MTLHYKRKGFLTIKGSRLKNYCSLDSSSDYENGIIPKENLTFPSSLILERGKTGIMKFRTIPFITKGGMMA